MFHGLSAFPITPCHEGGDPIEQDLRRVLAPIIDAGVDSIGILGSTGGYAYLTPDQRRATTDIALSEIGGRIPVIVGIGALRTDTCLTLARHAQNAGASGLLLAPVSYTPLTDDEVFAHFAAVAEVTDLPICIYDNPGTTHFSLSVPLLIRLADLPNVRAAKLPPPPASADVATDIAVLKAALPDGFSVGYSGDWTAADTLSGGADAFYTAAGGIWPYHMLRLARTAQSGDRADTAGQNDAFGHLWDLFRKSGSLRVVYRAANLLGLTDAQPPRPILPFADDDVLRRAIADLP